MMDRTKPLVCAIQKVPVVKWSLTRLQLSLNGDSGKNVPGQADGECLLRRMFRNSGGNHQEDRLEVTILGGLNPSRAATPSSCK